jgi:hypothetical protein
LILLQVKRILIKEVQDDVQGHSTGVYGAGWPAEPFAFAFAFPVSREFQDLM